MIAACASRPRYSVDATTPDDVRVVSRVVRQIPENLPPSAAASYGYRPPIDILQRPIAKRAAGEHSERDEGDADTVSQNLQCFSELDDDDDEICSVDPRLHFSDMEEDKDEDPLDTDYELGAETPNPLATGAAQVCGACG